MRKIAIAMFILFLLLAIATLLSASECMAADRLNLVMRPPTKRAVIYPVFWKFPEKPSGKPITI